ncbi:hypothetical protein V8N76_004522 [Salmonella enterica]
MKRCTAEGCDREVMAVGLCSKHYHQQRRARLVALRPPKEHKVCSVEDCGGEILARGLCRRHYHRQWIAVPEHREATRASNRRYYEKKAKEAASDE